MSDKVLSYLIWISRSWWWMYAICTMKSNNHSSQRNMSGEKQTNQIKQTNKQTQNPQTPNKPPEKIQIHNTTWFQRHTVIWNCLWNQEIYPTLSYSYFSIAVQSPSCCARHLVRLASCGENKEIKKIWVETKYSKFTVHVQEWMTFRLFLDELGTSENRF